MLTDGFDACRKNAADRRRSNHMDWKEAVRNGHSVRPKLELGIVRYPFGQGAQGAAFRWL